MCSRDTYIGMETITGACQHRLLMPLEEAARKVADGDTGDIPTTDRSRAIGGFPADSLNDLRNFAVEESFSAQASVNIFDIHGTAHPDYAGLSWEDLLQQGKRMRMNLGLLRQNPGYYLNPGAKTPTMKFLRLNGTLYLAGDGNHRSCIAWHLFRLLGISHIHGIEVDEYRVDMAAYGAWKRAKLAVAAAGRHSVEVRPVRTKLRREDSAGWHREYFRVDLSIVDRQSPAVVTAGAGEADETLKRILRPRGLRGLLGRYL